MSEVLFAVGTDPTSAVMVTTDDAEALARFLECRESVSDQQLCDKIRQRGRIGGEIELHRDELAAILQLLADTPALLDETVFAFCALNQAVVSALSEVEDKPAPL